jgi:hypothetical protein
MRMLPNKANAHFDFTTVLRTAMGSATSTGTKMARLVISRLQLRVSEAGAETCAPSDSRTKGIVPTVLEGRSSDFTLR